jgi:hypothetical protein
MLAAGLCLMTAPASAQTDVPPMITVIGEGHVDVVPDKAFLSGGVATSGKTAREASQANAAAMAKVYAALTAAGVTAADIQTSRLSLQPVREQTKPNGPRQTTFQANNQVRVTIHDLAKVSEIIDAMVSAGANDVNGLQYTVSDPSTHLDAARTAAVADAHRKAELYAKAAGVDIGRPIVISEEGATPPPMPMSMSRAKFAAPTPVSAGTEVLRASVTITYELRR